jgi:hypothetical protein
MFDRQDLLPVNLHFHLRLIAQRQPEFVHFLIFADKVRLVDPERQFLGWMTFNSSHSEIVTLYSDSSLKQIFVPSFRRYVQDEAMVGTDIFFSCKSKTVVCET